MPPEYEGIEWLWQFVHVVALARQIGGGALVAALNDLEIPEVAAALGVHDEPDDATPRPRGRPPLRSRRDLIAERMRHARGEGPPPMPDEPDPAVAAWAMEFAARTGGVTGGGTSR